MKTRTIEETDHLLGSATARACFILYGSVALPESVACTRALLKLVDERPRDVAFVYRFFPPPGAEVFSDFDILLEAAGEVGAFWPTLRLLVEEDDRVSQTGLVENLVAVGAETNLARLLREGGSISRRIAQNRSLGALAHVYSPPTLFLNGERVVDLTYEGLVERVRHLSANEGLRREKRGRRKTATLVRQGEQAKIVASLQSLASGDITARELEQLMAIVRAPESPALEEAAASLLAEFYPFFAEREPHLAQIVRDLLLAEVSDPRRIFRNPSCRLFLTVQVKGAVLRGVAWRSVDQIAHLVDAFNEADCSGRWRAERSKRLRDLVQYAAEHFLNIGRVDDAAHVLAILPVPAELVTGEYLRIALAVRRACHEAASDAEARRRASASRLAKQTACLVGGASLLLSLGAYATGFAPVGQVLSFVLGGVAGALAAVTGIRVAETTSASGRRAKISRSRNI